MSAAVRKDDARPRVLRGTRTRSPRKAQSSLALRGSRLPGGVGASLTGGVSGGSRFERQGRAQAALPPEHPSRPQARSNGGYDGASCSRLMGNWFPGGSDLNSLIATVAVKLNA